MCLYENFFLALSKVLIILLSESTLDLTGGEVIENSGLVRATSAAYWSLWRDTPSSVLCVSPEGKSAGALEGLMVKSTYVGSSSVSALPFVAFDDLKGSSNPFFLTLVCGTASLPGSGSGLCSFLRGSSALCSLTSGTGSTRGMCLSTRDCLAVQFSWRRWHVGEVRWGCGGKEIGRLPPDARSPSLKMTRGTTAVLFTTAMLILLTTELQWPPEGVRCLGFSATAGLPVLACARRASSWNLALRALTLIDPS